VLWQQFIMDLDKLNPDNVEEIFARHGAHSVTLTDGGDKPVLEPAPGETPLWNDTRITGLFSADADMDALAVDLLASLSLAALPTHHVEPLENREWEREWLKDFGPMQFGERLWICPGDSVADDDNAVVIRLDPGLAFGTGTHPTTAMCLEWLDGLSLEDKTMLDYGCGSGVLAIAALKLGCVSATGMDIDPQALIASENNAADNGVAQDLMVVGSDAEIQGKFDVVVANILAGPLVELAEVVITRLSSGGKLALSGILSEQVDPVQRAYSPWIEFDEPEYQSQANQTWARLSGKRRDKQ
jgi:ribosomal protein L11 methyltransferase